MEDSKIKILIHTKGNIQEPIVEDGVTWETDRQGNAGKLVFKVLKSDGLSFNEGDKVTLHYDGKDVFFGFVFKKRRDKSGLIEVTAYDQLRYLKNKETLSYTKKTADQVIKMVAEDFKLQVGSIEPTKFVIEKRKEDDQSLLDIILTALDITLANTKEMYILYDDFGKITLKNVASMKTNILVDETVAENFEYETSIDDETYNQIVLFYDNDETKKREMFIAQSSESMNNWGILKYTESLQDPSIGKAKADALLTLHNRVTRTFTVQDVIGSLDVRAGSMIVAKFSFDIVISNFMMVDRITHKFYYNKHTMDLTLTGAS